jgi:hypothetical protein
MKFSDKLAALGLYKAGNLSDLENQYVPASTIRLGRPGKDYDLSKLSCADIKRLGDEMDALIVNLNPVIQDLFVKNAQTIADAVRMVNTGTKQGFKGALASGNELDIQFLGPRLFHDPDAAAAARRTSWVRTITAAMVAYRDCPYINDLTSPIFAPPAIPAEVELNMVEEEALVLLGFVNDAATPCSNGVQITMNTEPYDIQDMDFEMVQPLTGTPLWELKEPWTIPPEQSGWIHLRYFRAGTDECKPIGAWVRMARNMRAL